MMLKKVVCEHLFDAKPKICIKLVGACFDIEHQF